MKRKYESEYELTSLVKGKKSYRYRGKWYHIDLDAPSYRRFWVCQLLLSLTAVGLLVGSGLVPSYSMYAFYAFLPYVVTYLPVLYMLVAMFMAPHLALLSVVLMFLTGCRVHIEHASDPEGDRKIRDYARGAEQTVRSRMGGTQRQERTPYNAPRKDGKSSDDNDDDFDSFTVE